MSDWLMICLSQYHNPALPFTAFCVHEITRRRLQQRVAVKWERKSHWASAHFLSAKTKRTWLTILAAASYELVIVLPNTGEAARKASSPVLRAEDFRMGFVSPIDPTIGNSLLSGRSEKFLANPPSFLLLHPPFWARSRQRDH